jgi:hypothetical protein
MSRMITCLYDDYDTALETARDLEASGVPTADISMIANDADAREAIASSPPAGTPAGAGAGVGTVLGGGVGLLAGLGMLAVPGIGPVVGLGWLAATAVGAVTGAAVGAATGGMIGSLTEAGVSEQDAHVYAEGVRRGGTLLSVRAPNGVAQDVEAILHRHHPVDIDVRGEAYRNAGWTAFDEAAPPYDLADIERERALYGAPMASPTTLGR